MCIIYHAVEKNSKKKCSGGFRGFFKKVSCGGVGELLFKEAPPYYSEIRPYGLDLDDVGVARSFQRHAADNDHAIALGDDVDLLRAVDGVDEKLIEVRLVPRQHGINAPGQRELMERLLIGSRRNDGRRRSELRHSAGAPAGHGQRHDGVCAEVPRGGACRVAHGIGDVLGVHEVALLESLSAENVAFRLLRHLRHDLDGAQGIAPHGGLAGQHQKTWALRPVSRRSQGDMKSRRRYH